MNLATLPQIIPTVEKHSASPFFRKQILKPSTFAAPHDKGSLLNANELMILEALLKVITIKQIKTSLLQKLLSIIHS
jgi:hypothetical protein